jgi:hypothetical protein
MRLYLSAAPEHMEAAGRFGLRPAYLAFRAGAGGRLLIRRGGGDFRGGLLVITDASFPPLSEWERADLSRELCGECSARGADGVLADFEAAPRGDSSALLRSICSGLSGDGRRLYVPESFGGDVEGAHVAVCTAVSGGTLKYRLCEALRRFGQKRTAVDIARSSMDFTLPSPSGVGRSASEDELAALTARLRPRVFYSPELCAKYFTYSDRGRTHLFLFDDAETIREKIRFAESLGICDGFLQYGETRSLLPRLFPQPERGGGR